MKMSKVKDFIKLKQSGGISFPHNLIYSITYMVNIQTSLNMHEIGWFSMMAFSYMCGWAMSVRRPIHSGPGV